MSRPASVTFSAILAMLGSLFTLLIGAVVWFSLFAMLPRAGEQPPIFRYSIYFTIGTFFALGAWGIATAIGLLRLKRWARASTLVFSSGLVFFSLCSVLFFLLMPLPPVPGQNEALMRTMRISLLVFYGLPAVAGIWWLVLFNRAAIKASFRGEGVPEDPHPLPLSITTIGWLLVTSAPIGLVAIWKDWPAILLGLVLTGVAANVFYLVVSVLCGAAGYGLLRRRTWAHPLTVWFYALGGMAALVFYLTPGADARMEQFTRQILPPELATEPLPTMPPWANALIAALSVGLPLYFLITRKKRYLESCAAQGSKAPSS